MGDLEVQLSSPGWVYLGADYPSGGPRVDRVHLFEQRQAQSYVLKICRPDDPGCATPMRMPVSIESGRSKTQEVKVRW